LPFGWRYRALYLSDSAAIDIARALGLDHFPYFVTSLYTDPDIADAITSLHRALEETTEEEEQTDIHMRLIRHFKRSYGSTPLQFAAAARARA
jgi:AraC-like DNA-binding protein